MPNSDAPVSDSCSAGASAAIGTLNEALERFASDDGMSPWNEIVSWVTLTYLAAVDGGAPPSPRDLEKRLLALVNAVIRGENAKAVTSQERFPVMRTLTCWQVAQILLRLHHVIRIAPDSKGTDREYDLLAMYQATGPARGTYTASEDDIRTAARRYNTQLTLKEFAEVVAILREDAPRRTQSAHRDLIAANNGIVFYGNETLDITVFGKGFRFEPKQLHPFDPAIVLLTKNRVDYVPDAPPQVITHPVDEDWDVVSWIDQIFNQPGDEGLADLIWEIIGAIIRPHVRWGKSAWFYAEQGNNGKGTLCALMRNLLGSGAHASIPLSDFGKDFALEPIVRANAIIVDENDVGTFIDKAANLKAIVTNDVIQINRKHRVPIAYQFYGFMVQCLNEFPRVKDKSDSFYRRQLFVPFTKSFTGAEKKYIRDDYLQRKEVLEYVFWYAINRAGAGSPGDYYELSEPPATKAVLAEYKEVNDPVRAFWEEFRLRLLWDLAPFTFLYDLYKSWFADVSPSGSPVSNKQFISDLVAIVRDDHLWHCPDKNRKVRPGRTMSVPEPLIAEYDLAKWKNPSYRGTDVDRICRPSVQANYRGLQRHLGAAVAPAASEGSEDQD